MIDKAQTLDKEKAYRIRIGLSTILSSYWLACNVHLTLSADIDNSISRASSTIGGA